MPLMFVRLLLVATVVLVAIIVGVAYALDGRWGAVGITAVVANILAAFAAPSPDELATWNERNKGED